MNGPTIRGLSYRTSRALLGGALALAFAALLGGAEPQDAPKPALPKSIEKAGPKAEEKKAETKKVAPKPTTGAMHCAAISGGGRMLALASADKSGKGHAFLWDLSAGHVRSHVQGPSGFRYIVFSPDGTLAAVGSWDKTI